MKNQPVKMTRSAAKGQAPLKKRPVSNPSVSNSPMKAKDRLRKPITLRNTKTSILQKRESTPEEEIPPTIAAGRSRRAVKPNPKYAGQDMVTPKNIKSGKVESDAKQRKDSGSSVDDFFNKGSSDEEMDEDGNNTEDDKDYTSTKKHNATDSNDTDESEDTPQPRQRGRPRKLVGGEVPIRRNPNSTAPTILNKSAPTRTAPTQLQQLRKTLGANTTSPLSLGKKRKTEDDSSTTFTVTPKRFLIPSGIINKANNISITRRSSPSQTLTSGGSKASVGMIASHKAEPLEKKSTKTTTSLKPAPTLLNTRALSATKSQQAQQKCRSIDIPTPHAALKTGIIKTGAPVKQNTIRLLTNKPKVTENINDTSRLEDVSKSTETSDDFESMPTFTIVNINDIINKKGDVLISKASNAKRVNAASTSEAKSDRRNIDNAQQQGKILFNKTSPDHIKPQIRTSTPLIKNPIEKTVNNIFQKGFGRNLPLTPTAKTLTTGTGVDKKPAPRILNSVVGRRSQQIKPVIANLDMTPDSPNCSLSIEEDEDVEASVSSADEIADRLRTRKSHLLTKRPNGSTIMNKSQSIEPPTATKENSLAATNYLHQNQTPQTKLESRILSPEKVVVSTYGDKVIKKITCFETWYVINIPEDVPDESERNILNMPLIEVANGTKDLILPSKVWTSKVTLYELSLATLAKNKNNHVVYTGELSEQNIAEEDRSKFQPSCVMFRRAVQDRRKSQLPYDRAVIFKNKTFFTNIEGKNVKLVGAPTEINELSEVETLLHIVDTLTLQSPFVEPATTFA